MEQIIWQSTLRAFREYLLKEERSRATTEKYCRDVSGFLRYLGGERAAAEGTADVPAVTKEQVVEYKQYLARRYAVSSANSMLAAVNSFLRFAGYPQCTVKAFRVQREVCRPETRELSREEYLRLLQTAQARGNQRLYFLMQTICATGIRVSELPFITVEALKKGRAQVALKGKSRFVTLPGKLCRELMVYIKKCRITAGSIFVTRSGRPMDRSNILHEMKALCGQAGVEPTKVFPHNLRHLFAITFYRKERDICHLADILGHATVNTTRIYTLVSSAEHGKQIDKLGLVI